MSIAHSNTVTPPDETSLELLARDDWFAAHASERAELEAEAEYLAWHDAKETTAIAKAQTERRVTTASRGKFVAEIRRPGQVRWQRVGRFNTESAAWHALATAA